MPKMGLEELSQTQEFLSMTQKQKMFVATFIENGYEIVPAIRTAYPCKNDTNAKIMSYRVMRSFNVAMSLSLHFGENPQEAFLNQLAREIVKGRITDTQLKAYTLYAEISGWKKSAIVRAYELAKEMGYGPINTKSKCPDMGAANLKRKVAKSIADGEAKKANDSGLDYDLKDFEK